MATVKTELPREYRGKRVDNGEWVYGYFVKLTDNSCYIYTGEFHIGIGVICEKFKVISETLGQFIGLIDKHETKIFDGDIVKMHQFIFDGSDVEDELQGEISYGCSDNKQYPMASYCLTNIKQEFIQQYLGCQDDPDDFKELHLPIYHFNGLHEESFEVIGNIYDGVMK
jgi:uncharacterized phage protein (TIGR01671 family)